MTCGSGFVILDDDGWPVAAYDNGTPIVFATSDDAYDWQLQKRHTTAYNVETVKFWNNLASDPEDERYGLAVEVPR